MRTGVGLVMPAVGLALLVAVAGCTEPEPLYCDPQTPCTKSGYTCMFSRRTCILGGDLALPDGPAAQPDGQSEGGTTEGGAAADGAPDHTAAPDGGSG